MSGSIFEQSFDQLMAQVGIQASQEPVEQTAQASPTTETPGNIFTQPTIQQTPEVKEDYRVDMNIFGPQSEPGFVSPQVSEPMVETPQVSEPVVETPAQPETAPQEKEQTDTLARPAKAETPDVEKPVEQAKPKTKRKPRKKKAESEDVLLNDETKDLIQKEITELVQKTVRKALIETLQNLNASIK